MAEVDATCDRFERAWQAGGRPRIEDDLGDPAAPGRDELLRGLLALEVFYRRRLGEDPTAGDDQARFPGHGRLIAGVLAEEALRGPPGGPGADPPTAYPAVPGYQILGELGRGGAGIVYLRRRARLNRRFPP